MGKKNRQEVARNSDAWLERMREMDQAARQQRDTACSEMLALRRGPNPKNRWECRFWDRQVQELMRASAATPSHGVRLFG